MNRRALGIVLAVLAVGIAGIVLLLATGGTTAPGEVGDDRGDAVQSEGSSPPRQAGLADALAATVTREGNEIVFEATFDDEIPQRLNDGAADYRWDILERGTATWIVSADLNVELIASVLAQQKNFGASTSDDTLPGSVEVEGSTLTIRVRPDEIRGFPEAFEWMFRVTLDADLADPTSAVLEDLVPDSGAARFEE